MLVSIVDQKTGEIADQFPSEYVLRLAEESKGR
jgi:uncharacterized FlaG/YvyC family protein